MIPTKFEKPKTAEELKSRIKSYVQFLMNVGVLELAEDGTYRVKADYANFGTAVNEKTGEKALMILLRSNTVKLEFLFVLEDKELMLKLKHAIDEALRVRGVEVA
jgi:hypothetical protein